MLCKTVKEDPFFSIGRGRVEKISELPQKEMNLDSGCLNEWGSTAQSHSCDVVQSDQVCARIKPIMVLLHGTIFASTDASISWSLSALHFLHRMLQTNVCGAG
jgi:hypothetical protein